MWVVGSGIQDINPLNFGTSVLTNVIAGFIALRIMRTFSEVVL